MENLIAMHLEKEAVMRSIRVLFLTIIVFAISASTSFGDDVIVIEDFEAGSYGQWTAEGDAFGARPRQVRMVGALGSALGTYLCFLTVRVLS